MNRKILTAGLVAAALLATGAADAQFMAADLLYIPGAAHAAGEGTPHGGPTSTSPT